MCISNRSSLSDGTNKTANNRYKITLSARAGSLNPSILSNVFSPFTIPTSPSPSLIPSIKTYTDTLPTTTMTSTVPSTFSTSTTTTTKSTTVQPQNITPSSVQVVNIELINNSNHNQNNDKANHKNINQHSIHDHYYYSDQDGPLDYYDNVDEISIPSYSIKPLVNKNIHQSSSSSSSNSLSQSSSPVKSNVNIESDNRFKLPNLSELRYDQSTLKSFFMNSQQTTENIMLASLKHKTIATTTSTEKSTSSPVKARDFEEQRQRILSFIISENQPSSFKAPSTTTTTTTTTSKPVFVDNNSNLSHNRSSSKFEYIHAFVNTQSSTTTESPSRLAPKSTILISRDQAANSKPIRLTLSSKLDDYETRKVTKEKGLVDDVRQSLHLKPIEPTTYSPPKSFKLTTETTTTEKSVEIPSNEDIEDPESLVVHSRRRPYVNDFLTTSTRFPPRSTEVPTTSTESITSTTRSIAQSFTSRGLVFKEILNKTFEPQIFSKPIVSPYTSLETQRLTNAIRTTTPRTNYEKEPTTSTTTLTTPVPTYRSYFLITAPPKTNTSTSTTSVPSTYLFPESSTINLGVSNTPTASPLILSPTEIPNRGKYRPYLSPLTSSASNSIDEEATTYSPRVRFSTRTTESIPAVSSEQPARRKVIRLKSSLTPPVETQSSSTERVDITTYNPSKKVAFVPSQPRESSDFRPILTKLNEFISKLSHSVDLFAPTSKASSFNELTNENVASVVEVTDKPFFYTRLSNLNNINRTTSSYLRTSTTTESQETSTKKFRATVEMPEMDIPKEKDNLYDEEENDEIIPYLIDDNNDLISIVSVESSTQSSTVSPSTRYYYSTTTKTTTQQETKTTVTVPSTTTIRTTTDTEPSSTTTNPKSLVPPRATRVNNAIKSSIIAGLPRRHSNSASIKCNDVSANAKCNEIPSRYCQIQKKKY